MMWTKRSIGSFNCSRKSIRTAYYTLLLIIEIINATYSFCVVNLCMCIIAHAFPFSLDLTDALILMILQLRHFSRHGVRKAP